MLASLSCFRDDLNNQKAPKTLNRKPQTLNPKRIMAAICGPVEVSTGQVVPGSVQLLHSQFRIVLVYLSLFEQSVRVVNCAISANT